MDSGPAPPDGGWGWVVLACSFMNEVLLIGFVKAIGVLFTEWKKEFNSSYQGVAWIGSILAVGGPFACMLAGALTTRYGTRPIVILGGLLTAATIGAMSFCSELWQLYLIAIITGVGFGLAFQPSVTITAMYFHKRLGTANGIAFSGVGVGIIVMPPLLQALADIYGWRGAIQISAAIMLFITLNGFLFRPTEREKFLIQKNAEARESSAQQSFSCLGTIHSTVKFLGLNLIFVSTRMFLFVLSFAFLGFGYFGTVVFYSSNAVAHNISSIHSAYLVSAIGVGSAIFRGCHGFILDLKVIGAMPLYVIASLLTALTIFFTVTCSSFVAFVINGFLFGSFTGLAFAVLLMCLVELLPSESIAKGLGVTMMMNGVGVFFGLFIMGYLRDVTKSYDVPFYAAAASAAVASCLVGIERIYHRYQLRSNVNGSSGDCDAQSKPKDEEIPLDVTKNQYPNGDATVNSEPLLSSPDNPDVNTKIEIETEDVPQEV